MFSGPSRLRWLSVLLPLVLVAPPLGGRLSDRPAAQAASRQPRATTNNLRGVACPRPSICVAVGERGTILRSTDEGSTWSGQTSGTTNNLTGIACLSPSTCVAVGDSPILRSTTILRSTDGGNTWSSQSSQSSGTTIWSERQAHAMRTGISPASPLRMGTTSGWPIAPACFAQRVGGAHHGRRPASSRCPATAPAIHLLHLAHIGRASMV
jgi:hypothetical protein